MMTNAMKRLCAVFTVCLLCASIPLMVFAASEKTASGDASGYIGVEAAKEIVLAHAGAALDAVTFTKVKLDYDDGLAEYEIKFIWNATKYEYEINALSGEITGYSKKAQKQAATKQASDAANYIGIDKAKEIALADADASSETEEVTFTKAKLDYDDGLAAYEITFIWNEIKYEYEINALSGEIIGYSQKAQKQAATASDAASYIGIDKAKEIALAHAGFTEAEVVLTKSKLDYDNGIAEYEIEFYIGGTEYEYEINAITGVIMDYEVEAR